VLISLGDDAHGNVSSETFFAVAQKHVGRPRSWVSLQLMLLKWFVISSEFELNEENVPLGLKEQSLRTWTFLLT